MRPERTRRPSPKDERGKLLRQHVGVFSQAPKTPESMLRLTAAALEVVGSGDVPPSSLIRLMTTITSAKVQWGSSPMRAQFSDHVTELTRALEPKLTDGNKFPNPRPRRPGTVDGANVRQFLARQLRRHNCNAAATLLAA